MMFNHPIPPPSPGIPKPPFPFQWQGTGAANGAESASKQFLHTHDVPVETQTLADAEAAAAGETTPVAEVQVQVQAPAPAGEVRVPPAGPLTGRNLHTAAWVWTSQPRQHKIGYLSVSRVVEPNYSRPVGWTTLCCPPTRQRANRGA